MRQVTVPLALVAASVVLADAAHAEPPRLFVFAGTSYGARAQQGTAFVPNPGGCGDCPKTVEPDMGWAIAEDPSLATFAVGVAGSEGRLRGGGELFAVFGVGERASGYAAGITYVGVESGRLFALFGLGIGTLWGGDRLGRLKSIAANSRGELGVRLTDEWRVLLRGDVIANSEVVHPVGTLGLQWSPKSGFGLSR